MWLYNNKEINCIDDMKAHNPKVWGFVYLLSLYDKKTNKLIYQYIGKKNIYSKRKRNFGKKEIASLSDKRQKKYEYVIKESDWKNYISSNLYIKKNSNKYNIKKEILLFSTNDSELTYLEAKEIICNNALYDDTFLNNGVSLRKFIASKIK